MTPGVTKQTLLHISHCDENWCEHDSLNNDSILGKDCFVVPPRNDGLGNEVVYGEKIAFPKFQRFSDGISFELIHFNIL